MMQKGRVVLGKIVKPSALVKYLSRNEAPDDGYDYIVYLDNKLVIHCEESDIERVLRFPKKKKRLVIRRAGHH